MTADQVVRHLSKDDPVMWGRMTEVERAAYERGWLDASAAMFAHLMATSKADAGWAAPSKLAFDEDRP